MRRNAEQIMLDMGFPESEQGPYVTELRKVIAEQVSHGLVRRSGGTWAPECFDEKGAWTISHEDRARAFLEVEWEMKHGHTAEVKNLDGGWDYPLSKLGDLWRRLLMDLRVWRDKVLLGRVNPYRN